MMHVRIETPDGQVVCEHCRVADSPWLRLRGLLGRSSLEPGSGLFITPGASIHTLGMRFAIDVVFLDRDVRVVRVAEALPPWRVAGARGAGSVLELAAGEAARRGIAVGDQLRFTAASLT